MAANLGLVAHAAERDADELAVHRARNRLAERRLADPWRSDETEYGALDTRGRACVRTLRLSGLQLLDRQVLDDSFFDLIEIVVVLIEDFACGPRIEAVLRRHRPGHVEHPVDVGANHLVLGRRRGHAFEAIDFPVRYCRDVFRQLRFSNPAANLRSLRLLAFSELFLNRLQLLAKVILPLSVGHLLLGGGVDLAFELEQRDFTCERI